MEEEDGDSVNEDETIVGVLREHEVCFEVSIDSVFVATVDEEASDCIGAKVDPDLGKRVTVVKSCCGERDGDFVIVLDG